MIKEIKILPKELKVIFNGKKIDKFPNIWLRDHAKDEENWDNRSNQRKIFTAKLNPNLYIKKAEIRNQGKTIEVFWSDMKNSVKYPSSFLFQNSLFQKLQKKKLNFLQPAKANKKIFFKFDDVLSEKGFKKFLKTLHNFGFSVIKNCNKDINSVEKIAKKIGYVRHSIFGGLWKFQSNETMADSAYTQNELRPHTDSTYSNDAPGLQLLLCCHYNAKGGESIMVDGFKIAEKIKKENKDIYDLLTSIEVTGQYIGDGVILESKRPILRLNSKKELLQVSFNNYDRAPFRLHNKKMLKFYEAIKKFDLLANNKQYQWRHILKPGELLIFNNWRILHGRGSFKGSRKMAGCYINKEDFDSCCRVNGVL
tara:strand:- start:6 stop:1103 length:1098 start_codon:yes stop_codon:yes gene_type:complete